MLGVCVFTSTQGLLRLREVWDIFASNILYILSLLQNLMIVVWNSRETLYKDVIDSESSSGNHFLLT